MKKILITGGLGCIGTNISDLYLSQNYQVDIIDVADQPRHIFAEKYLTSKYNANQVLIIKTKLEEHIIDNIEQYDLIIHMAASTNIPMSVIDPINDFNCNILATFKLLEQLRAAKKQIPTVIFSSVKPYKVNDCKSIQRNKRYEWYQRTDGINELNNFESKQMYAASKLAISQMAQAYAFSYDLPITTLRFSNLYGTGNPKKGHGWLTSFCVSAALGKTIEIQGTGFQCRDMLFMTDIWEAIECARKNIDITQKEIFNVGGGYHNTVSVLEAVDLLEEISGNQIKTSSGEGRRHEDLIFITDYRKFYNATGWQPKVSVKEGMTNIYEWALKNKEVLEGI